MARRPHRRGPTSLDRVAAAVDAAGAGAVVGYSLGARVALGLLAAGRAPAAVLIGVSPGLTGADERRARAVADAAWAARLRAHGTAAFADAWETLPMFATQARAPASRRAARRARRLALDPEGLACSLETLGLAQMPDYRAALAGAARAGRAHLVVGADDARYLAMARELVAECPGLGLDVIPDSGHDPTLEQPGGLARVLARALERVTTRAPTTLTE